MQIGITKIEARLKRKPQRIAIFRALVLGDLLCSIPALRALRAQFPESEITLVGLPWARSFVQRFNRYFDDFVEFPGFPGLPEIAPNLQAFPAFVQELQRREFDLAIQLHGSGAFVNPLVHLFGACVTAGFYKKGEWLPDAETFLEYPEDAHEIRRFLRLMEFLGVAPQGDALEFPLGAQDAADFARIERANDLQSHSYAVLHVGSNKRTRRWFPERFATVADELAKKSLQIVLTGTPEEKELTDRVARLMRAASINLCGKTSLGALGFLVKNAGLVVSNDTSVQHIAAALNVPSVVVWLAADTTRWLPLNKSLNRAVYAEIRCRPCGHDVCPTNHECAAGVTTDAVLREAFELLEREDRRQKTTFRSSATASAVSCLLPTAF